VLNGTIGEPPPQYEEIDNQRNSACVRHSERQHNLYATADDIPKKYSPTVDMETCTKTVDCEKAMPPAYEASCEKKLNVYDVPDEVNISKEEQPYQEITLPQRSFASANPYSLSDDDTNGYETPVGYAGRNDNVVDLNVQTIEGASYDNKMYDISDA
jgi:hypothetical protein